MCVCVQWHLYMFVLIESQFLGLSQKEVKTISDMDQHPVQRSTAVLGERERERERKRYEYNINCHTTRCCIFGNGIPACTSAAILIPESRCPFQSHCAERGGGGCNSILMIQKIFSFSLPKPTFRKGKL